MAGTERFYARFRITYEIILHRDRSFGKSSQTARKTGTDGIKLPLAVVTIQLANNHCGFDGEILTQIVANDFLAGIVVHHAAVGIGYLAEVLTALFLRQK